MICVTRSWSPHYDVRMKLNELFLAQLDRETRATRRVIENAPEGIDHWKPHEKSMELGYLTSLVASMFSWIEMMIDRDFLDLAGDAPRPSVATTQERLELFDRSVAQARRALTSVDEEKLMQPWQLRVAGKVVDEKPRHVMIADTFTHLAHHRGQLSVYLRLNDKSVPSIYGPTADEKWG